MVRILWVSRHAPLAVQVRELVVMFGADCEVVHRDIPNSAQLAAEFNRGGYADLVCVVPLATLDHICREGLKPLWADMVETTPADGREPDLAFGGKMFWFTGFRRVTGVSLDLVAVESRGDVRRVLRVTRHSMQEAEFSELQRLFGMARGDVVTCAVDRIDERVVVDLARREGADEVVLVAPYSVFDALCRRCKSPLYAVVIDGVFVSLHRVQGVTIKFEEV